MPRPVSRLFIGLLLSISLAHAEIDPPGRVGWLDYVDGAASLAPAGSNDWQDAAFNRPLTSGDSLWVAEASRSELYIGSMTLRLGAQTSLRFAHLDDDTLQLDLQQGTLALKVRNLFDGQLLEIDTPNLAFTINRPGEYRIDVKPEANTTTVTSWQGDGTVHGDGQSEIILRGTQQTIFTGTRLRQLASLDQPRIDEFDRWLAARDAQEDQSVSARYVSRELTGYQALDSQGSWHEEPGLGAVWTPRITIVDWAPYRYGRWQWIAPWGWTWVDDQRWGFAPFHYGRWTRLHDKWCWVPGKPTPRPVYAPALVAFSNALNTAGHNARVAWLPLAPGEAYHPHYAASPRYINNLNQTAVAIRQALGGAQGSNSYVNQRIPHAISSAAGDAFVHGRPVQQAGSEIAPKDLQGGRFGEAPAVIPVLQSALGNAHAATRRPPSTAISQEIISAHPRTRESVPHAPPAESPAAHHAPAAPQELINALRPPVQVPAVQQPAPISQGWSGQTQQHSPPQPQTIFVPPSRVQAPQANGGEAVPGQAPTAVIRPHHPLIVPAPHQEAPRPALEQPAAPIVRPVPALPVAPPAIHRPEGETRREPAPAPQVNPQHREQTPVLPPGKERRQGENREQVPDIEARKRMEGH